MTYKTFSVDIDADGFGCRVEIGAINKQNDLFPGIDGHHDILAGRSGQKSRQ